MPYFKIETNQLVDKPTNEQLLKDATAFACELLGKPENYMMVSLQQGISMSFAGDTSPAAYVKLKSIGLKPDKCGDYSKSICEFVESKLGISPYRIYIDFADIDGKMFGWNKKTF
ncbi:MAG: phenylpyruvate tautomerase MIF-related protein [Dissulfuribacterales bacterium]